MKKCVPTFLISLFEVLKGHNKVSPEPCLLQAEKPQIHHPFFTGDVFHPLITCMHSVCTWTLHVALCVQGVCFGVWVCTHPGCALHLLFTPHLRLRASCVHMHPLHECSVCAHSIYVCVLCACCMRACACVRECVLCACCIQPVFLPENVCLQKSWSSTGRTPISRRFLLSQSNGWDCCSHAQVQET